ncbi:MAG: hypothetical protein J7L66_01990 [Anaerolineaceae bacterium]|nr:hypothetical protein [Anaerolineaceae bacterium]
MLITSAPSLAPFKPGSIVLGSAPMFQLKTTGAASSAGASSTAASSSTSAAGAGASAGAQLVRMTEPTTSRVNKNSAYFFIFLPPFWF